MNEPALNIEANIVACVSCGRNIWQPHYPDAICYICKPQEKK